MILRNSIPTLWRLAANIRRRLGLASKIGRIELIESYRMAVKGGDVTLYVPNINAQFRVPARSDLVARVILERHYERELGIRLLGLWRGPGVFVNIGANVGFWVVFAGKYFPQIERIIACEPNGAALGYLRANIASQGLGSLVEVYDCCVSDREEKLRFSMIKDMPEYSSIGEITHSAVAGEDRCEVEMSAMPLDKIIGQTSNIRLMLVDVEGSEFQVISGGKDVITRNRPIIVFECSGKLLEKRGHSVIELVALLNDLGYKVRALDGQSNIDSGFDGDCIAWPTSYDTK